jgi:hypothetical protein
MQSYSLRQPLPLTWIKPVNVIDILHGCRLFLEVQPTGFQRLATIARRCHFRKGQVVFRENFAGWSRPG